MPIPSSPRSTNSDIDHLDSIDEDNEEWISSTDQYWKEKSVLLGSTLTGTCKSILIALLPSYIGCYLRPSTYTSIPNPVPQKVHKTGWLDGLRGTASLIVMIHHSGWLWAPELSKGYGSCADCYHWIQLPFFRLFISGSPMVAIFFVVSGFSLSHRALGLIRNGKSVDVLESLSSSTFRRGIRLVLPPIVVTFFMMILSYNGAYPVGTGRTPPRFDTFWQSFWNWFEHALNIADIFRPVFYSGVSYAAYIPVYDPNLWTIDVEFHGSLVIFLTLLGVSKLRPWARLLVLIAVPLWVLYFVHSYLFLFLSGILLAELHHIREDRLSKTIPDLQNLEPPPYTKNRTCFPSSLITSKSTTAYTIFWTLNFVLSLYILSIPLIDLGAANTYGYQTLVSLIPSQYHRTYVHDHFWIYIGAVYLVFTIDNSPFLQKIFTTRFARYLGKIGFALYLVHGTVLFTLGFRLDIRSWWFGGAMKVLGVWVLAFWVADLVWRGVDEKSVAFAKWFYGWVSVKRV